MAKLIFIVLAVVAGALDCSCSSSWNEYFPREFLQPDKFSRILADVPLSPSKANNILESFS